MKKLSKKALTGIVAAGFMTVIGSIAAFAATTYPSHPYRIGAGHTIGPVSYRADDTYMYFDTRPSYGAGGVYLKVTGPGVYTENNFFPYQVSRSPLKINTSVGIRDYYDVYLTAGSTDISGALGVWTSSN
ncbi:MAG: hypothetical protein K2O34_04755 [Acetatifactor sp.]|nr:hypothetical protein [Acetatifactor sp.]